MDEILITLSSSNQQFHSLNDAQEFISTNDIVTFLSDVTIVEPVVINKKCTIDLGGHFMFISIPSAITIKNGIEVEFLNGKIQTLSSDQLEDAIIVQGSKTKLYLESTLEISTRGTAVHARKRGTAVVNGALVSSTGTQPTIYVDDENSSLVVESGFVESYEKTAIVARSGSSVVINGGEIHTESNGLVPETTYPSIRVEGRNSSIMMNGGTVFSPKTAAVVMESASNFEMHDGEIYSHSEDYIPVEIKNANTSFKMYGGFLHSPRTSAILSSGLNYDESHSIQMIEGKMGGVGPLVKIAGSGDHDILFSGGEVKGILPQEYIATGYVISDIKDDEGYAPIILKTWVDKPVSATDSSNLDSTIDLQSLDTPYDSDLDTTEPLESSDINPFDTDIDESGNYTFSDSNPFEDDTSSMLTYDTFTAPDDNIDTYSTFSEIPPNYSSSLQCPPPPPPPPRKIVYNSSVNITHKIYIYNSPSRKHVICEWRGALGVLSGGYYSYSGEEFAMVKFRVPGSGATATGYVPVYDISHP